MVLFLLTILVITCVVMKDKIPLCYSKQRLNLDKVNSTNSAEKRGKGDGKPDLEDFVKNVLSTVDEDSINKSTGFRPHRGGKYDPTVSSYPSRSDLLDSSLNSTADNESECLEQEVSCEVYPSFYPLNNNKENNPLDADMSDNELSLNDYEDEIREVFYSNQKEIRNERIHQSSPCLDHLDTISQLSDKTKKQTVPISQELVVQPANSLSKEEEVIIDEFLKEPDMEYLREGYLKKSEVSDLVVKAHVICQRKSAGHLATKKRSFIYTNQSIALNVATTDDIYKSTTAVDCSNDQNSGVPSSANVIMVSDSNKVFAKFSNKRSTFSASSSRSCDFLPEIAGDPGLSLQSSNPKVIFSNNHYNVVSVDSH